MVSPAVAAALADRAGDAVEAGEAERSAHYVTTAKAVLGDLFALSDGALDSLLCSGVTVGEEFRILRELRRRFLCKVDGGA